MSIKRVLHPLVVSNPRTFACRVNISTRKTTRQKHQLVDRRFCVNFLVAIAELIRLYTAWHISSPRYNRYSYCYKVPVATMLGSYPTEQMKIVHCHHHHWLRLIICFIVTAPKHLVSLGHECQCPCQQPRISARQESAYNRRMQNIISK